MAKFLSNLLGSTARVTPTKEVGVSSTAVQSGIIVDRERNPSLRGINKYLAYEDMLANISIVAASVRLYSDLFAKSEWKAEPVDDSAEAQRYADILQSIIFNQQQTWESVVKSAGLFVFWGFSVLEMTANRREDGIFGLQSIEQRAARTITRWDVDESGNVNAFLQTKPLTASEIALPRDKCIYLVDNLITDSPEGMGMFRQMAEIASDLKELQIDEKVGVGRDMRGLPIGRAPLAGLNKAVEDGDISAEQSKALIEGLTNIVTMVRKGERTGVILDSATYEATGGENGNRSPSSTKQWDLELLQSQASGLSDVDKIIRRKNMEIARIAGTEILLLGQDGAGSLALSQDKTKSLMLRINGTLKDVAGQFNRDLVSFIWRVNSFPEELKPSLTVSEISQRDIESLAATIRELASAGVPLNRGDEAVYELYNLLGLTPPEALDATQEVF